MIREALGMFYNPRNRQARRGKHDMKVFIFDLLPYGRHLDHLKVGAELPYPLVRAHFDAQIATRTYAEHLDAWEEIDRLGYDGIGFNEHHCSPYGLMNSPNLLAASIAQRTKNVKLLIYGNLLPLHEPLRLAEELAMLDCLSNGRLIAGFARGIPREYQVHNVSMADSRARFEEAFDIILGAWREEVFSYQGKFWSYKDVAMWPRPLQTPHPPLWMPITGSQESIEFAGRHNMTITPGQGSAGLQEDIIRYFAKCLAAAGHTITPQHLAIGQSVYIADTKAQAIKDYGPYHLYFNRTLFSHGNFTERSTGAAAGYVTTNSSDYVRPENRQSAERARADFRNMTMDDVTKQAEHFAWGNASEVTQRIIAAADRAGSETVLLSFNRGALPQEMFVEQIRRFAHEVLPALQAHQVTRVPAADVVRA
jgi:alkanesulfonate monooxygenase SsuD/methylene tetrahydromethanopterin reductase-like flavin-dependent oxidoreductase (luciferase family)